MSKKIFTLLLFLTAIPTLTGCSGRREELAANELVFDLRGISSVEITYDEENITFLEGSGNKLMIREYMTDNRRRYHARTEETDGRIHISEGKRPFFKGSFSCHVEVYLPRSYDKKLTVITTQGRIDCTGIDLQLASFKGETTSGELLLSRVKAETAFLQTTRGKIELEQLSADICTIRTTSGKVYASCLKGNVDYVTTHGDIQVDLAFGSGSYRAENDGKLQLSMQELDSGLTLHNKNGDIELRLPENQAFRLEAVSKNGSVISDFVGAEEKEDGRLTLFHGEAPRPEVKMESKNGDLSVKKIISGSP